MYSSAGAGPGLTGPPNNAAGAAPPRQEAAANKEFTKEGLVLNFVSGSTYLGAYLGPQAELEAWVKHQVEAWDHGVKVLAKIDRQHPQSAYAVLGLSLQPE